MGSCESYADFGGNVKPGVLVVSWIERQTSWAPLLKHDSIPLED